MPRASSVGSQRGLMLSEGPVVAFIRLLMRYLREREMDKLRQVLKNAQY